MRAQDKNEGVRENGHMRKLNGGNDEKRRPSSARRAHIEAKRPRETRSLTSTGSGHRSAGGR
jgi:hypothetical protein